MISKRTHAHGGYTALEALILLVVLVVLAMTSMAVYQKLEADAVATQSPNQDAKVQ